jgi:hypothetical protein
LSLGDDEAVSGNNWLNEASAVEIFEPDLFELRCEKSGDVDKLADIV